MEVISTNVLYILVNKNSMKLTFSIITIFALNFSIAQIQIQVLKIQEKNLQIIGM